MSKAKDQVELRQLYEARKRITERIEALETHEAVGTNRRLLGKCFSFQDRYNAREQWLCSAVIVEVDEEGWLHGIVFYVTSDGRHVLEDFRRVGRPDGWVEISTNAFRLRLADWYKAVTERMLRHGFHPDT